MASNRKISERINEKPHLAHIENFPQKGTYILIFAIFPSVEINVGSLGVRKFPIGYYSYTGSALGRGSTSLSNRISRHLRDEKTERWHIDFLLKNRSVCVEAVIIVPSDERLECKVNQLLKSQLKAKIVVPNFGASDCHSKCASHLLYFSRFLKKTILIGKIAKILSLAENCFSIHCVYK